MEYRDKLVEHVRITSRINRLNDDHQIANFLWKLKCSRRRCRLKNLDSSKRNASSNRASCFIISHPHSTRRSNGHSWFKWAAISPWNEVTLGGLHYYVWIPSVYVLSRDKVPKMKFELRFYDSPLCLAAELRRVYISGFIVIYIAIYLFACRCTFQWVEEVEAQSIATIQRSSKPEVAS